MQDPYDNPQHSKVLKHFAPLHMMWMLWDAICVCLELQQGQYNITQPQAYLKLLGMEPSNLQKIITVKGRSHVPIQNIATGKDTYVNYDKNVGSHLCCWYQASDMILHHCLGFTHTTHPRIIMHPELNICNSVRGDPYAQPQHSKRLKHFVCLTYDIDAVGCNLSLFKASAWTLQYQSGSNKHTPSYAVTQT